MKKILASIILILFVAISAQAQKRTLDIDGITEVSLGIPATLYVQQGNSVEVMIDCDDNTFEDIEFEQRGDRLTIQTRTNWGSTNFRKSEVDIYVTMKTIRRLGLSGSGEIIGKKSISCDDLKLGVSGSGNIDLEVEGDELDMRISGSGKIELKGKANRAEIGISGSGDLRAEDLEIGTFEASISGSGTCRVYVLDEINANISGSGNIYYSGDPKRVISNASGSGKTVKN